MTRHQCIILILFKCSIKPYFARYSHLKIQPYFTSKRPLYYSRDFDNKETHILLTLFRTESRFFLSYGCQLLDGVIITHDAFRYKVRYTSFSFVTLSRDY